MEWSDKFKHLKWVEFLEQNSTQNHNVLLYHNKHLFYNNLIIIEIPQKCVCIQNAFICLDIIFVKLMWTLWVIRLCFYLLLVVQVFARRDVSGSACADPALFHQWESCAFPAQHIPIRRPSKCQYEPIKQAQCIEKGATLNPILKWIILFMLLCFRRKKTSSGSRPWTTSVL